MEKELIHSGTFLGYGDRKITVNFYKRGYYLTLKEGVSSVINVPYNGSVFAFSALFNTNGSITGNSTYAYSFTNTAVFIKENRAYYEREWRVTFRLREDDDVKATILFVQEGAPNDLTANPETMMFSGRQEFIPLALSSSVSEPVIYGFDGDIIEHMMSEDTQPIPVVQERDDEMWLDTWYVGLEANTSGTSRTGLARTDTETTMGGLNVPIVQESIDHSMAVIADINIHDEGQGKEVEMGMDSNEGYIEFSFANYDEIERTSVEFVDVGYGTDWISLRPDDTAFTTRRFFDVESVPAGEAYLRRWVIIRVYNADRPDDYAECMLIQNNY